jgi:hypothetical protein
MSTDPTARMKAKLQQRVLECMAKTYALKPGEKLNTETGEITVLTPAMDRLRWLPQLDRAPWISTHDGVFVISGARVNGRIVYTAWKRSKAFKWLLGSRDTVGACKALCEAAIDAVPAGTPQYELGTDFQQFLAQFDDSKEVTDAAA